MGTRVLGTKWVTHCLTADVARCRLVLMAAAAALAVIV